MPDGGAARYQYFLEVALTPGPAPCGKMYHIQSSAQFGPPSVRLCGFQLWIHSRAFPEALDEWDGNWLNVTVHCGESGASVWVTGAILESIGLQRFRDELALLYTRLSGEAVLQSHEPNVRVRVAACDSAGHLNVWVEITPEHLLQHHWFEFQIDQSYLPPVVAQLDSILVQFPARTPTEK